MARYKPYNLKQDKMIPLSAADQVMPGSFEYALNEIVEAHLDLTVFEQRYHNDETGRLAYDPKVLLKIVSYGDSKGMVSIRSWRKCAAATWCSWPCRRWRPVPLECVAFIAGYTCGSVSLAYDDP